MKLFDINRPIPQETVPETDNVSLVISDEPLVCISDEFKDIMFFCPKYFEQGLAGAAKNMYVRKTTAEMLLEASRLLPEGVKLKVFDAWRPQIVQKTLFDRYFQRLSKEYEGSGLAVEERVKKTREFVSYPSDDPMKPFAHETGGAVDLTLTDAYGNELDMGTRFDDFSTAAYTAFFETGEESEPGRNRRILYNAMLAAGFTNLPSEWWHYDYGDNFWGALTGNNAIYQGIYDEHDFGMR